MSTYLEKKEHIYAYRRRKAAVRYVEKLNKIVQESSKKDAERLMDSVNSIWWAIEEKLGWFDDIPKGGERSETASDRARMSKERFVDHIARYICPECGRPGYLFSPNLDLEGRELDLYILHIVWPEKKTEFCHISPFKKHLILISTMPVEGILTMKRSP